VIKFSSIMVHVSAKRLELTFLETQLEERLRYPLKRLPLGKQEIVTIPNEGVARNG